TRTWDESRRLSAFDAVVRESLWVDQEGRDVHVTNPRETFPHGPTAIALSPDHKQLVTAWPTTISYKWQQIVFWDVEKGTGWGPTAGPREDYAMSLVLTSGGILIWQVE